METPLAVTKTEAVVLLLRLRLRLAAPKADTQPKLVPEPAVAVVVVARNQTAGSKTLRSSVDRPTEQIQRTTVAGPVTCVAAVIPVAITLAVFDMVSGPEPVLGAAAAGPAYAPAKLAAGRTLVNAASLAAPLLMVFVVGAVVLNPPLKTLNVPQKAI